MNSRTYNKPYPLRPCTIIFIVLIALTLITWQIGRMELSGTNIIMTVLGFAIIKGAMIGDYYMGLRNISGFWRWLINAWLLVTGSLIAWAFISAA